MTPGRVPILLVLMLSAAACRRPEAEPQLEEIAVIDTSGWAHDVRLDGDEIYVSDRQGGFAVFDRGDLSLPPRIAAPVTDVISLALNSGKLLLAARFEGLVLSSRSGSVLARYSNGDISNAVEAREDLAFIAYGLHGLVVARVTDSEIRVVSELASPGWSHYVRLIGDRAFLADWDYGLRVVDIADPERPVEVGVLPTPKTTIALDIRRAGGDLLVALAEGHAGVAVARVDDGGRPFLAGRNGLGLDPASEPHPKSGGWAHGIAWSSSYLFVANWKNGLVVLDGHDLRNLKIIAERRTGGTALGVAARQQADGSHLVYLADGESGLRVFRFTADAQAVRKNH